MRNLLFLASVLSSLALSAPPAPKGAPTGKVVQLVGNAKAADRTLNYGDMVYAGETIRTENGSRVKILMTDRSIIDVGEDSAIRIRTYPSNLANDSSRELEIDMGSMRTSVKKSPSGKGKFFIRTKSSVLAVRGTELVTNVGNDGRGLDVTVFEGEVLAGNNVLTAGQRLSQQGGAPQVRTLTVRERESVRNNSVTETGSHDFATQGIAQDNGANRQTASLGNFDTRLFIPRTTKYGELGFPTPPVSSLFIPVSLKVTFVLN